MRPDVTPFHHAPTGSWTYVVADPASKSAVIVDPVLDYDWRSARTSTHSAEAVAAHCEQRGLAVRWILETHAHADHLSAAQFLKSRLGAAVAIGEGIRVVQATFKRIFGLGDEFVPDGAQFDRLLADGETLEAGGLAVRVIAVPGHTNDSVAFLAGDALFVGDTVFMPDSGSARCDFPGGDARALPFGTPAVRTAAGHPRVRLPRLLPRRPARPLRDRDRGTAGGQHPYPRRGRRGRVRRDAHCARRDTRRTEPADSRGAGEHPRRPPAAG